MKKLTHDNFEEIVNSEKRFFIIKFFSPTCGPCHTMTPVFQALNNNNPDINVYEVDTTESPELAAHFGVRGVPFVAYCENREILYSLTGVTRLVDLQFVIDNIDDGYFRTHGEFKVETIKKNRWFELIVVLLIIVFVTALFFTEY